MASQDDSKIFSAIRHFLLGKAYKQVDTPSFFYNFRSANFSSISLTDAPIPRKLSLIRQLGLKTDGEIKWKAYAKELSSTRKELPVNLEVMLYAGEFKGGNGYFVEILSKPAIYFQLSQLNPKIFVSQEDYSFILAENIGFLSSVAKGVGGYIVEDPKPLDVFIETKIINEMKALGFTKPAAIIEDGRRKIETGAFLEGTDCLRRAIENFLVELVNRLGGQPSELHKPEQNLRRLEELGFLEKETCQMLQKILNNGLYNFVTDAHHRGKAFDLLTSRFCFDSTENLINYLIERTIKYRILARKEEGNFPLPKSNLNSKEEQQMPIS